MSRRNVNNKAQITIFIILGLIIVVGFFIVFLLMKPPEVKVVDEKNPQAFIESCTREGVEEAIELLSKRGGDVSPKGFVAYEGEEITYLCYNANFYDPCINQRPLLVEHIEEEITKHITPIVAGCFNDLETKLGNRYDVEVFGLAVRTRLQSKNVVVEIDKEFKMARKGESRDFTEFRMHMASPIYDLAKIAMEIVNQEISFCNFDELGFMILNPKYDIIKFTTGEADVIYVLTDLQTDQKFTFAVRSCKLPEGY